MRNPEQDIEFLISQYVDGLLDSRSACELERRLESDPDLRELSRRYIALRNVLKADDGDALAEIDYQSQREEIMAAVQRRALVEGPPARRVAPRPVFGALAAAAAILLVASVGLLLYTAGPSHAPKATVAIRSMPTAPTGPGQVEVSVRRVEPGNLAMSVLAPASSGSLPPGTVVVSTGGMAVTSDDGTIGDMFFMADI